MALSERKKMSDIRADDAASTDSGRQDRPEPKGKEMMRGNSSRACKRSTHLRRGVTFVSRCLIAAIRTLSSACSKESMYPSSSSAIRASRGEEAPTRTTRPASPFRPRRRPQPFVAVSATDLWATGGDLGDKQGELQTSSPCLGGSTTHIIIALSVSQQVLAPQTTAGS